MAGLPYSFQRNWKYFSGQYKNRILEYLEIIDNNKSLNIVLSQVENKIKKLKKVEKPSTEWKFVRYLYYEITTFKLQSTIGRAVSLPLHFYKGSNEKNVVKFENYEDNLCFWRCLAAYKNPDKKDYRLLEKASKQLYKDFYGKKYEEDYEGVKYLEYKIYKKWYDEFISLVPVGPIV